MRKVKWQNNNNACNPQIMMPLNNKLLNNKLSM